MTTNNLLAVIPARGGSIRIPHKNLHLYNGKPLVVHAAELAGHVTDNVLISTDDDQIAAIAQLHGYKTLRRPASLADKPVLDVARHAADAYDHRGPILLLQPTCPLITPEHLQEAIRQHAQSGLPVAAATLHEAVTYLQDHNGCTQRHRAALEGVGFYVVTFPVGDQWTITHIPREHAVDIDYPEELAAARFLSTAQPIRFTITATSKTGSGHLHRALAVAREFTHCPVSFDGDLEPWAIQAIKQAGHKVGPGPATVRIFDKLDTTETEMMAAKPALTVTFEDQGPGARLADIRIDDMYPPTGEVYTGSRWCVMRPEFVGLPTFLVTENATRVLVTFGGTDPSRLTERFGTKLADYAADVRVVAPRRETDANLGFAKLVYPSSMAQAIRDVDLVVTSCGRTVYEAAACGVPVVAVAANAREATHVHVRDPQFGVVYMGLHTQVSDQHLAETVIRLLSCPEQRQELSARLRRFAPDGLAARRIARLIEDRMEGL